MEPSGAGKATADSARSSDRPKRFAGKSAIVTGGGMGMGRAIALRLASEGAKLSIFDIDPAAGEETIALIAERGESAAFLRCDLTRADDVRNAVDAHVARWRGLDVLVNNAGLMHRED